MQLHKFRHWLWPPATRVAGVDSYAEMILRSLLWNSLLWLAVQFVLVIPIFSVRKWESAVLASLGIGFSAFSLRLLDRGQFQWAARSFLFAMWGGTLICTVLSGGIRSIYMVLHVWIPIITALLLGSRAGTISIAATATSSLVLSILDGYGYAFPRYFPTPGITAWMILMLTMITTVTPVYQMLEELRRAVEVSRHAARHDGLTGLPNRSHFFDRLAQINHTPHALLFLDLDDFKHCNDSRGHAFGDQILREAARRLQDVVGSAGMVARIGGDEFTILLEGAATLDHAIAAANQVLDALQSPFHSEGQTCVLAASIGIALATPGVSTPEDLLKKADEAMYRAKTAGKSDYAVHPAGEARSASA